MKNEITTLIFSKNRACQLELLLRNLTVPATVQYTCDPEFKAGYEKLTGMYPNISFVKETEFKKTLLNLLKSGGEYVMFLVDDDVALAPFSEDCPEFAEFKKNPDILCLSLRAAPYYKGAPVMTNNTWNWKSAKWSFGYPMSASSHIFRKADIFPVLADKDAVVDIPNDIEVELAKKLPARPLMMCFDKPKFISNLANQVQSKYAFKNLHMPVEALEERFLKGERLSLEHMRRCAERSKRVLMEVPYEWEKDSPVIPAEAGIHCGKQRTDVDSESSSE